MMGKHAGRTILYTMARLKYACRLCGNDRNEPR
jgi:hypothetical protein